MRKKMKMAVSATVVCALVFSAVGIQFTNANAVPAAQLLPETETLVYSTEPADVACSLVKTHEYGGKSYVYDYGDVEMVTFAPPEDFDPLEASDEKLAEYGFPARPEEPERLAEWTEMMQSYNGPASAGAPQIQVSSPLTQQDVRMIEADAEKTLSAATSYTSRDFSGYVANGTTGKWGGVEVQFTVPSITIQPRSLPAKARYFTRLGSFQKGVEIGYNYGKVYVEYDISGSSSLSNLSFPVSSRDILYLQLTYRNSGNDVIYYIQNKTTGKVSSGTITPKVNGCSFSAYDGSTACWGVGRVRENWYNYYDLYNFGVIVFSNCRVYNRSDDIWDPMVSGSSVSRYLMVNESGDYMTTLDSLPSSGTGFSLGYSRAN